MLFKTIVLVSVSFCCGCASFNAFDQVHSQQIEPFDQAIQVRHGRPNKVVDNVGQVLGIPHKLALWDRRANNHNVSQKTEADVIDYLNENELNSVMVRVNQYDPLGEYKRLLANDRIRPIWRATVGGYHLVKYTVMPGRLFGGDWYNPYTDTVHLYSDIPSLAISKAAYADDLRSRLNPGAYAAVKGIPIAGMYHETTAMEKATEYYTQSRPDELEDANRVLYPNLGAEWGGQIASFVPYGHAVGRLVGAGVGHITDQWRQRRR